MGTCWQYLTFRGKFLKIEPCDKDGTSHAWVNWYYGHFKQTRMVDFTHAPAISHNLNYISRFIQSHMSQAVTTRDFVQYGRHLPYALVRMTFDDFSLPMAWLLVSLNGRYSVERDMTDLKGFKMGRVGRCVVWWWSPSEVVAKFNWLVGTGMGAGKLNS